MEFASSFFIFIFLPIALLLYYIQRSQKAANVVLVILSLAFYLWGREWYMVLPLMFTAVFDFVNGRLIRKHKGTKAAKFIVANSIIVNLLVLGIFKYSAFFAQTINSVSGAGLPVVKLVAPLGISFYTFMTISYILDCYWEKIEPEQSFLSYLTYISLFAHITAGPITRYADIRESLHDRDLHVSAVSGGLTRIAVGLAKKVILANNLYVIVGDVFGQNISGLSFLTTVYGALVFSLYVYFDFSGYCDMAIGIGKLLGLELSENFNYPFLCKDVSEFWRRWHITLGSFFRDYLLYVPIFGLRNKYLSLFVVWFTTGLWHGASWNYIIWGLYFGFFILLEGLVGKKRMKKIPAVVKHIYSKIVIVIGFGIFYFTDFSKLIDFFKNLVFANGNSFSDNFIGISITNNLFLLLAAILFCFPVVGLFDKLSKKSKGWFVMVKTAQVLAVAAIFVVSAVLLVDTTSNPFLYAQF